MDMRKFCDALLNDADIKDIPLVYVFRVVVSVFSLINSGEFYYTDYE